MKALKKYGNENFTYEILAECDNIDDLNQLEKLYIEIYNSYVPIGYNIREGGRNGKQSIASR